MDDDPDDCSQRVTVTMTMDVDTYDRIGEQLDRLLQAFDVECRVIRE